MSDHDLARALHLATFSFALSNGWLPSRLEAEFRVACRDAGYEIESRLDDATLRAGLAVVRSNLSSNDGVDGDAGTFRRMLEQSLREVESRPVVYQAVPELLIGGGLVLALAWTGKISYRNGKWEIAKGLPGFDAVAKALPSLFRTAA